jgi:hypothetical protein
MPMTAPYAWTYFVDLMAHLDSKNTDVIWKTPGDGFQWVFIQRVYLLTRLTP